MMFMGGEEGKDLFDDEAERKAFVSKVYAILTAQLAVTAGIICAITIPDESREYVYDRPWLGFIFIGLALLFFLPLGCCECARRIFPLNIILLILMTLAWSGMAGILAAQHEIMVVMYAFGATAMITFVVTFVAKWAPCDITGCGILFVVAFIALGIFGIVAMIVGFFLQGKLLHLIYSGIAVVLLSLYLMFVTQLIIGGRMVELEPDEYILAVIILYTTIIELFMHLLTIIQACFDA